MKRRLVIMRHAKSSWKSGARTDHERPLNKRGRRDAPKVAARLVELGWCPRQVLSSSARRTRETFARMQPHLGENTAVSFRDALYEADAKEIRGEIASVPAEIETVLVLGHNPDLEDAVQWLTGERTVLKTANAALLTGEGETWREAVAEPLGWKLEDIIRSREL